MEAMAGWRASCRGATTTPDTLRACVLQLRREYAGDFDYEVVEDAGIAQQGWQTIEARGTKDVDVSASAAAADAECGDDEGKMRADSISMGNPLSSYKR